MHDQYLTQIKNEMPHKKHIIKHKFNLCILIFKIMEYQLFTKFIN